MFLIIEALHKDNLSMHMPANVSKLKFTDNNPLNMFVKDIEALFPMLCFYEYLEYLGEDYIKNIDTQYESRLKMDFEQGK